MTSVDEIMALYNAERENLGFVLDEKSVGRIISDVWGERVKKVRKSIHSKRSIHYLNLRLSSLFTQSAVFGNLDSFCPPAGWTVERSEKNPNSVTCFKITSIVIDNERKILCVYAEEKDGKLNVKLKFGNIQERMPSDVGLEHPQNLHELMVLFRVLDCSTICTGRPVLNNKYSLPLRDTKKDIVSEEICLSNDGEVVRHVRSVKCLILARYGDSCEECNAMNRVFDKRKSNEAPHKKCNTRYLTVDQLKNRINEKNCQIEKDRERERQLLMDIENQKIIFDEEDNADFSEMFKMLPKENLPPDLQLLIENQAKQLNAKSPKGYRWHPK